MPFFIPLILIGGTIASIIASATIPQPISDATKAQLKTEIINDTRLQNSQSSISRAQVGDFLQKHFIWIILAVIVFMFVLVKG